MQNNTKTKNLSIQELQKHEENLILLFKDWNASDFASDCDVRSNVQDAIEFVIILIRNLKNPKTS